MKRIAPEDLARVALSKGASVQYNGKTINPSGQQHEIARPNVAPPMPPAPAPPVPAPPERQDSGIAAAMQANADRLTQLTAALMQHLRTQPQPHMPNPITEWKFSIDRDDRGVLTGIRATATRSTQ